MAIIGIDLGTTNSLAAAWQQDGAVLIPNALGEVLTPSVVSIDTNGEILVGRAAKDRLVTHPDRSAAAFKRRMGNREPLHLSGKTLTPEELSSLVIAQLRQDAEAFLGERVDEAVVSVPAYFNEPQRRATRVAAELAGLKVERLINEPTAAAIAYGLHEQGRDKHLLVVDLGGGTFDVSVMELFDGVMEVHASAGDNFFGGEDFDDLLSASFLSENDIDADTLSREDSARLRARITDLRHALTTTAEQVLNIRIAGQDYRWQLDRTRFEALAAGLLKRLSTPVERALRDSRLVPANLDDVILVGGATRMPAVRSLVGRMLRCIPRSTISPDHVVALGAAVQAGLKRRDRALRDVVLTDVSPYTLGVEIAVGRAAGGHENGHFMPIIERNSTVPVSRTERLATVSDEQEKILCSVYQGESRLVKNNIRIGSLEVPVPKALAGEECVDVRFTYDINGILEVQVTVASSGDQYRAVIRNAETDLTEAEIEASIARLAALKIHPRDQSANRAVLARAERMYEESLGEARQYLGQLMAQFESVLDQQDADNAEQARAAFEEVLDEFATQDLPLVNETCWQVLQIDPTSDRRSIKRAYARLLRRFHPEDDPEGFERLQNCYQRALELARRTDAAPVNAGVPYSKSAATNVTDALAVRLPSAAQLADQFIARASDLYNNPRTRADPTAWRDLLADPVLQDLAVKQILIWRAFAFLAAALGNDRQSAANEQGISAETVRDFELRFDWAAHELELSRRFSPEQIDLVMFQLYGYRAVARDDPACARPVRRRKNDVIGWIFVVCAVFFIARGVAQLFPGTPPADTPCLALLQGNGNASLKDCKARVAAGDARAAITLAYYLASGEPLDSDAAREAYAVASGAARKTGDANALFVTGSFEYAGIGVTADADAAAANFHRAADAGLVRARAALGALMLTGDTTQHSVHDAFTALNEAAENGFALADLGLGLLYRFGYGAAQDVELSLQHYRQAAQDDMPRSTNTFVWLLATSEDERFRDTALALEFASRLEQQPGYDKNFAHIDTVAAANAAAGRFDAAVAIQERALAVAQKRNVDAEALDGAGERLLIYQSRHAFTDTPRSDEALWQARALLSTILFDFRLQ